MYIYIPIINVPMLKYAYYTHTHKYNLIIPCISFYTYFIYCYYY